MHAVICPDRRTMERFLFERGIPLDSVVHAQSQEDLSRIPYGTRVLRIGNVSIIPNLIDLERGLAELTSPRFLPSERQHFIRVRRQATEFFRCRGWSGFSYRLGFFPNEPRRAEVLACRGGHAVYRIGVCGMDLRIRRIASADADVQLFELPSGDTDR